MKKLFVKKKTLQCVANIFFQTQNCCKVEVDIKKAFDPYALTSEKG